MTVEQFAETYYGRTRRDECGETIIPSKRGHQIYEHGDGRFGVLLMFDTPGQWTNAKKKLLAAGFAVRQNGDTEGTALFNPEDKTQARFAFKITGARIRRQLSPEKREELARRLQSARGQKAA